MSGLLCMLPVFADVCCMTVLPCDCPSCKILVEPFANPMGIDTTDIFGRDVLLLYGQLHHHAVTPHWLLRGNWQI